LCDKIKQVSTFYKHKIANNGVQSLERGKKAANSI